MRFLDTNVVLRYLTGDDPAKAQACYELFQRVQRGDEELFATESVAAEVAYVLSSRRGHYRLGHAEIASRLHPILALRGVRLPQKLVCLRALDFFARHEALDFEDALALAHMERLGMTEIVSYDRDFDGIPEVIRSEP